MFDKQKYDKEFDKQNYTHMNLTLPKQYRELLVSASIELGTSKNAFVKSAIDQKLKELGLL